MKTDALCEQCSRQAVSRSALTAYYWDGTGENPNRDVILCNECYEDYAAHWNAMWKEYYSSQGF